MINVILELNSLGTWLIELFMTMAAPLTSCEAWMDGGLHKHSLSWRVSGELELEQAHILLASLTG